MHGISKTRFDRIAPTVLDSRAPKVAKEAFGRALDAMLRAVGDPLGVITPILSEYPDFVMGHLLRASVAVLSKDAKALPSLASALEAAARAGSKATEQERRHLEAARAWLAGEPGLAAERYAAILRDHPHDLIALRLALSCYFFDGQTAALRDVVELVAPAWERGTGGFEYVLAMSAFAYAENGENERAEMLGRWAVEIEPHFPFAIHAVAHALHERRQYANGRLWMRQRIDQWMTGSRMAAHNAWHLAQFELGCGNPAGAVALLDEIILPAASESANGAADATALLCRLHLDGIDPGTRWRTLADYWRAYHSIGFAPFLDLHAAIAFNAARDFDRLQLLEFRVAALTESDGHHAHLARNVTMPGLRAIRAFAARDYAGACTALHALRSGLGTLGASHAQLALFKRVWREARRRSLRSRGREVVADFQRVVPKPRGALAGGRRPRLTQRYESSSVVVDRPTLDDTRILLDPAPGRITR